MGPKLTKAEELVREMDQKFTKAEQLQFLRAVDNGNADVLNNFLDRGFNTETPISKMTDRFAGMTAGNNETETPLIRACKAKCVTSTNILLQHNARLDVLDNFAKSPLYYAVANGSMEITNMLLRSGAQANFCGAQKRLLPLHVAVTQGRDDIVALLLRHNADVNALDALDQTPLLCSVFKANFPITRILLDSGADVNEANASPGRPLYVCLREHAKHENLATLLLERGASVNCVYSMGKSALHIVDSPAIARLLLQRGSVVDSRNERKQTPLHTNPNRRVVEVLIKAGADLHAVDEEGNTALHLQVQAGNLEAAKAILQTAEGPPLLLAENKKGETSLHMLARSNVSGVVRKDSRSKLVLLAEMLIEHGASLHAVDMLNRTPQDVARENNMHVLVSMLSPERENANVIFK